MKPQRKSDGLNELLTIGGGVLGAAYGGPSGAIAGAGAGQMAGGILNPPQQDQQPVEAGSESSAMQRRLTSQTQDNLGILQKSEAALPSLPESLRQQYAPAIIRARMLAQKG